MTEHTHRWIAPALLFAAMAPAACHKSSTAPTPERDSRGAATPTAPAVQNPDATLREAVRAELKKDKHLDEDGIQVSATNGIVELTGKVDNALSLRRATRVAEVVRGVRAVSNRIEVDAPKRPDADIEQDVQKALHYVAATAKLPITVKVEKGVPTLTGTVGSWQEQQLAERVADGVRGVRFTKNDLSVRRTGKRDAARIAGDVKSRLAWDALVEHDPLEVSVKDQRVTLRGSVGSAAEKTRAVADAWVDGVDEVDASAVTVQPTDRPDRNVRTGKAKTDEQIAKAIKDAALYDPRVRSFNFGVSVVDGVATLGGTVETLQAKRAAESLARNTVGVRGVENRLVAKSQQPFSDQLLQNRIEEALVFDPLTDARDIHLAVKDGEVTLAGSVGTFFERAEALDVASRMAGVTNIVDQLQVRDQVIPYVYSVWLDPYDPLVEDWYLIDLRTPRSDADIKQRIAVEFSWSPFIFPEDVQVEVHRGKVTLTGTVHSSRERLAATQAALKAGALSVDNRLKATL
jgi:osmotically-inducible protein OsmY